MARPIHSIDLSLRERDSSISKKRSLNFDDNYRPSKMRDFGQGRYVMASAQEHMDSIKARLVAVRKKITEHRMYKGLTTLDCVRIFMQYHVFSVWDFMTIAKSIQHRVAPSNVFPWVAPKYPALARIMNEIITDEETDQFPEMEKKMGLKAISHYGMYLRAMEMIGADMTEVKKAVANVEAKESDMWKGVNVDRRVKDYVNWTLRNSSLTTPTHLVLGNFLFGRENIIPAMFESALTDMFKDPKTEGLRIYMERHIEVDGDEEEGHAVQAEGMLKELCGTDASMWNDVYEAGLKGLENRVVLWDAICDEWEAKGLGKFVDGEFVSTAKAANMEKCSLLLQRAISAGEKMVKGNSDKISMVEDMLSQLKKSQEQMLQLLLKNN